MFALSPRPHRPVAQTVTAAPAVCSGRLVRAALHRVDEHLDGLEGRRRDLGIVKRRHDHGAEHVLVLDCVGEVRPFQSSEVANESVRLENGPVRRAVNDTAGVVGVERVKQIERGCLLIADIGGYTRYLKAVELEHAHDVLADLIGVVADTLSTTFTVDKLEGDAVFAHRSGDTSADQLVELVRATGFAFKRRQRDIDHNTSCACRACTAIPELELKFVIHHGEFVERKMARSRELVGTDVVRVHRLLKNTVTEKTGLHAYALLTEACVDQVDLDPVAAGLIEHHEAATDVEKVHGWVLDLEGAWRDDQDRTVVYVEPGSTRLVFDIDLPASPTIVWDWVNSAERQRQWQISANKIDMRHPKGVWGVGTTSHCIHGKVSMVHEVVDSKPFKYFTLRTTLPFGRTESTWELTPGPETEMTHLQIRMRPEQRLRTLLATRLVAPRFGRMMAGDLANLVRLLTVENELGSSPDGTAVQSDSPGPQR